MSKQQVIGRFAPTPSGPLHFGSLVTAVASYCHARSQQGKWLLRVEDVDTPRNVDGAVDDILYTLEAFGFEWDGEVLYQSRQFDLYEQILEELFERKLCYACECSRKTLREAKAITGPLGLIYPGFCKTKRLDKTGRAIRLDTANFSISFVDLIHGQIEYNLTEQLGDFVVKRADGIYAYHLAVVIDDAYQGVNQIVRGADLLESTCLHIFLQNLLDYPNPEYLHIPLVINENGDKLSKQTGAEAIDVKDKCDLLIKALKILGQSPDYETEKPPAREILETAIASWDYRRIVK